MACLHRIQTAEWDTLRAGLCRIPLHFLRDCMLIDRFRLWSVPVNSFPDHTSFGKWYVNTVFSLGRFPYMSSENIAMNDFTDGSKYLEFRINHLRGRNATKYRAELLTILIRTIRIYQRGAGFGSRPLPV